jgi:hypothetical protein
MAGWGGAAPPRRPFFFPLTLSRSNVNKRQLMNFFGVSPIVPGASSKVENVIAVQKLANNKELRRAVIEEVVSITAAAFVALTQQLPAGSTVIQVDTNFDTAIVLSTAVKLGVGTSGDPDAFLLTSATVAKNTQNTNRPPVTTGFLATATTPRITACDTSGAAAGTQTSGTIRVRIVYEYATALPTA